MTKSHGLLALLALYALLLAGMHLYMFRGKAAKPFTLAAQMINRHMDPDLELRDGTVLHWYDDNYTSPYTRCWGEWMNTTRCVMVWEEKSPCEKRVENVCRWLYPHDSSEASL